MFDFDALNPAFQEEAFPELDIEWWSSIEWDEYEDELDEEVSWWDTDGVEVEDPEY